MGNTTSGAFIAVKITNDPSIPIVGGSSVTGIVYLDVQNENIPCDSLNVCLVGHENTRVLYYETVPDGKEVKQVKELEYETHVFLRLDCVLAMFPQGKVTKGRYEFPFVFPLPPGIPGRLYASSLTDEDTLVISYHLEARLHRKDVPATTSVHHTTTTNSHHQNDEVKNSLEIMVCDPPRPVIPLPSFVDPVTTAMRFSCCWKTGTMTLIGSLDSASVDAGEEVKIFYALHNDSTTRMGSLLIKIIQEQRWHAHKQKHHSSFSIFTHRILGKEMMEMERIDALRTKPSYRDVNHSHDAIIAALSAQTKRTTLALVPLSSPPSCHTHLASFSYHVEITLMTPFGFPNPTITLPLFVHRNNMAHTFTLENDTDNPTIPKVGRPYDVPEDWHTTVLVPAPVIHLGPNAYIKDMGLSPIGVPGLNTRRGVDSGSHGHISVYSTIPSHQDDTVATTMTMPATTTTSTATTLNKIPATTSTITPPSSTSFLFLIQQLTATHTTTAATSTETINTMAMATLTHIPLLSAVTGVGRIGAGNNTCGPWSELHILQTWLKHLKKPCDKEQLLVTDNLRWLFQHGIIDEYSYLSYPVALGEAMPGKFTIEMIVAAAMGVPDEFKPRVLGAFAMKAWIGEENDDPSSTTTNTPSSLPKTRQTLATLSGISPYQLDLVMIQYLNRSKNNIT